MVQTRSQERHEETNKRRSDDMTAHREAEREGEKRTHREAEEKSDEKQEVGFDMTIDQLLAKHGKDPLNGLNGEKLPPSQVVMAHILNALLSSARIPHQVARSALDAVLKAKYNDLKVLQETSWYERTEVLTEGGYSLYRERMADFLGDLQDLMEKKYDGNAGNILPEDKQGDEARAELAARLREIKGLGPVGVDIALGGLQSYFTTISPFLDDRSLRMAEEMGLGVDVDRMYEAVGSDASNMARLEVALTEVRLEKAEGLVRSNSIGLRGL